MFDDGKILILDRSHFNWIMAQHPIGNALREITLDDQPRDWYVKEDMDASQWAARPDIIAYLNDSTQKQ